MYGEKVVARYAPPPPQQPEWGPGHYPHDTLRSWQACIEQYEVSLFPILLIHDFLGHDHIYSDNLHWSDISLTRDPVTEFDLITDFDHITKSGRFP